MKEGETVKIVKKAQSEHVTFHNTSEKMIYAAKINGPHQGPGSV